MYDLRKKYFNYWGKTLRQPNHLSADYHLLPYHCLDVAAVGQAIFNTNSALRHDLARFLELTEDQLASIFAFMLALHDLGKFSSSFQKLYSHKHNGAADGFYFGLPTMATSNAMVSRVAAHYQQIPVSTGMNRTKT